jgi:hypothetical protein
MGSIRASQVGVQELYQTSPQKCGTKVAQPITQRLQEVKLGVNYRFGAAGFLIARAITSYSKWRAVEM